MNSWTGTESLTSLLQSWRARRICGPGCCLRQTHWTCSPISTHFTATCTFIAFSRTLSRLVIVWRSTRFSAAFLAFSAYATRSVCRLFPARLKSTVDASFTSQSFSCARLHVRSQLIEPSSSLRSKSSPPAESMLSLARKATPQSLSSNLCKVTISNILLPQAIP